MQEKNRRRRRKKERKKFAWSGDLSADKTWTEIEHSDKVFCQ